jgi:general secretion pathway protein G
MISMFLNWALPGGHVTRTKNFMQKGMTLLELVIASSILLILSSAALPIVRHITVRDKEVQLSRDLREMRDPIDRYKDLADQGKIRVEAGTEGYPPDLETLVKGVNIGAGSDTKIRFLRRIPIDPRQA